MQSGPDKLDVTRLSEEVLVHISFERETRHTRRKQGTVAVLIVVRVHLLFNGGAWRIVCGGRGGDLERGRGGRRAAV